MLYRIGSSTGSIPQLYTQKGIAWTTTGIQVLGIFITHIDMVEVNYNPVIEKAEAVMKIWRNRNLTLIGKISVINTLVASLFVHKMQALPCMTQKMIDKIESLISQFIWNDRKAKNP